MTKIGVVGAGAFGTALALALARDGRDVVLWARDADHVAAMRRDRTNAARLPGVAFPDGIAPTADPGDLDDCPTVLLSIPAQALSAALPDLAPHLSGRDRAMVACCKGIDLATGTGPTAVIAAHLPQATAAILSGPSFAADIAAGLPTALTLGCRDAAAGAALQKQLSTPVLRLYRSTDVDGVEIGGALKNVVAIACGMAIGAGLGESARAALMTRGYAEMLRLALAHGAEAETLAGLSGLGDLALTCASEKSRNYSYGLDLGRSGRADPSATTEGLATARAVTELAAREGLDMPITRVVAAVLDGDLTVPQAAEALLSRPLKPE